MKVNGYCLIDNDLDQSEVILEREGLFFLVMMLPLSKIMST